MNRKELLEFYKLRVEKYKIILAGDKRTISWLSLLRLLVFVGGIILAIVLYKISVLAGSISLLLTLILFGVLLKMYSKRTWLKKFNSNMLDVNRGEIRSINEDYSSFGDGSQYADSSHDFSHDIDMFGKDSVFQSINRCCTEKGNTMLADWLLNPAVLAGSFNDRSEAIKELSEKTEWRQKFLSLGMMNLTSAQETESFYEWMKEKSQFSNSRMLNIALVGLPALTLGLFFLWAISIIGVMWFVCLFMVNLSLVAFNLVKLNRIHVKVSKKSSYLSVAGLLIEHIDNENFKSTFLKKQQSRLGADSISAIVRIKKLASILQMFDSRLNMIMGVLLNGVLMWDYQCVVRIEKWKTELAYLVPIWFETIASIDAINSLGTFANNNPDFVYPELSDGSSYMLAEKMGHHLIPFAKRITNNYSVPASGAINIVTGANMAGKSTFLRTVAVNMVLAMTGAPVCASRFVFTPVDIYTSMRTSDSLSEEESYFFAELKRLRRLIDLLNTERKPFFILDEILKGTNSKDKSEGSLAFLEKVVKMGGTGLIATHDISLGKMEEAYPVNISNTCFEIEIEDGNVRFDYILRKGITSKMNAALLMKQQGII